MFQSVSRNSFCILISVKLVPLVAQPNFMQILILSFFFSIRLPPGLLPVLGLLERYMTPTLDAALLSSSRAGANLGRTSDVES